MNQAQVCLVAKALADTLDIGGVDGPVVVAHDARRESPGFARDIAAVLRRRGRGVIACRGPVATPVASWVARTHEAPAAVVVTASHNPIGDAGVKVFGPNGAQVIPPQDGLIRAAMDASVGLKELADHAPDALEPEPAGEGRGGLVLVEDAHGDYEEVELLRQDLVEPPGLLVATSALHGVAGGSVVRLLEGAGHRVHPVEAQQDPDPTFPTLTNPNPEDPVTLELLLAEARDVGADLALANDPDGDRLAVAVPVEEGWRILSGNEIGILLADHLLTERSLLVTTVVSTPLVDALARAREAICLRTWTGFKWIAAAIDWAERTTGAVPTLGFEEALGFCVGDVVRDKDGIRAATAVAGMAAALRRQGQSLVDRLARLQEEFGVWVSESVSLPAPSGTADELIDRLVGSPPDQIDGRAVLRVIDHRQPVVDELLWTEQPPAIIAEVRADGARLLVRPSGTEPKVKLYAHLHQPADGDPNGVAESLSTRARAVLAAASDDLGLATG
jgi:phosphomannomutase